MDFLPDRDAKRKQKMRARRQRRFQRFTVFILLILVLIALAYVTTLTLNRQTTASIPTSTVVGRLVLPTSTQRLIQPTTTITRVSPAAFSSQEQAILELVNAARRSENLNALQLNPQLTTAASAHSQDMADGNFLAHEGSDGSRPADRVNRTGYLWRGVGENVLFRPDLDADGAFQQWWDSPPHHENMMNPDFTEIGIAYAVASDGTHYYTMVLATPR